jgi:hypothetical protein
MSVTIVDDHDYFMQEGGRPPNYGSMSSIDRLPRRQAKYEGDSYATQMNVGERYDGQKNHRGRDQRYMDVGHRHRNYTYSGGRYSNAPLPREDYRRRMNVGVRCGSCKPKPTSPGVRTGPNTEIVEIDSKSHFDDMTRSMEIDGAVGLLVVTSPHCGHCTTYKSLLDNNIDLLCPYMQVMTLNYLEVGDQFENGVGGIKIDHFPKLLMFNGNMWNAYDKERGNFDEMIRFAKAAHEHNPRSTP